MRHLDGLGYEEVVRFTDPTGVTARRYRAAYNPYLTGDARQRMARAWSSTSESWFDRPAPIGPSGEQVRGTVDTGPAYQHQLSTMGQR
jgi:hypothetical protein